MLPIDEQAVSRNRDSVNVLTGALPVLLSSSLNPEEADQPCQESPVLQWRFLVLFQVYQTACKHAGIDAQGVVVNSRRDIIAAAVSGVPENTVFAGSRFFIGQIFYHSSGTVINTDSDMCGF